MKPLLLVAFAPVLMAQSAMTFRAGVLSCGAVRRSANTVQTFCWAPGHVLLAHNTINIVCGSLVMSYQLATDTATPSSVTWTFTLFGGSLNYTASANGGSVITGGSLCAVYPVVACAPPAVTCVAPPVNGVGVDPRGNKVPMMPWTVDSPAATCWIYPKIVAGGWSGWESQCQLPGDPLNCRLIP